MNRKAFGRLCLFAFFLVALFPGRSFCNIYEYADADGKVLYYKYTDRNGSVVFTDNINAVPPVYRKKHKIIRVGVPGGKKDAGEKRAPESPPAPEAPPVKVEANKPEAPQNQGQESGFPAYIKVVVGLAILLAFVVGVGRMISRPGRSAEKQRIKSRGHERTRSASTETSSGDRQQEALNRYLQAKDFASAARFCESLGNLEKAAAYYREAGNFTKAGEVYAALKDYRNAAAAHEKAGDDLKAAELFEICFQREDYDPRASSDSDSALRSGRLFEKAGQKDRALALYLKAKLFNEAAPLLEKKQDFILAAESYLKAGNAEKAAACFERGGSPEKGHALLSNFFYEKGLVKEAALFAEKAGDLMRAAEMFQEAGDHPKAGELFGRAGFYAEAGENYLLANDQAGAAAAFEKGGKYLPAAKASEASGAEPARVAELFEKGEDFHAAGRLYIKASQPDKALNALQHVDPASENGRSASLLIGMLFLKKGKIDLAREKFLKIIDDQPIGKSNLDPYYFLALCYESSGDTEKAKSIFAKILIEDYNFRDVRQRAEKTRPGNN